MIVSTDILKVFESGSDEIAKLELTYKNGGVVNGTIRKLKLNPLRIVVQKSLPEKGERPRHKVVFDHVTSLKITFVDGTVKDF